MVETKDCVQFYLTGKLPKDISPEAKIIPGKLIVSDNDKRFIPGKLMTTAEGDKFVPGQTVNTTRGEEFIPGQIVESSEGPKFIPGQVVMTVHGEKFVPGQVIVEDEGPRFVPGQIIQTKNGATFIPGQMMNTDEGQLFVPGQLVETNSGPRFVPGQVAETPEGPKFIPGNIIETEEGLKYVPPNADEIDEDFEISFQGFEVSDDELALLMSNPIDTEPHPTIMNEEGLIDSQTLKKLAVDTMVVHGATPDPPQQEKKKKKKRSKVQLDIAEEEPEEVEEVDEGTEKVDVLLKFIKATSSISESRREKEMRRLATMLGEDQEWETTSELQLEAMTRVLAKVKGIRQVLKPYIGSKEETIAEIVDYMIDTESVHKNEEAKQTLRTAINRVVTKKCDKEIDDIIQSLSDNPENLLTDTKIQILLTEAVGIVLLRGEPEVGKMLQILQTNPEGLKDRKKVRELLKSADVLLKKPKAIQVEESETDAKFDLRHVASSKDIPTEIFEQIKEDRKEATKFINMLPDELFREIMQDKRCGESLVHSLNSSDQSDRAKRELEKFKTGMAIVVTKENMQAVIPREFARSVCYGIVPYVLIDEEGIKFFERGLTGRKLAPARVIENTWYMPDSYYSKKPFFQVLTKIYIIRFVDSQDNFG
ncbi:hypothetical protein Pmani_040141 [Petrolisthes manimaculis]|uniref:Uncharacterized protein n=1 Tax=Petrolisthes manimaculis TaxID=1843537 RepID=A0AAE1NCB6_9EUCA|nr:hypothetical protein Pmani_040141 [Petrolisthes manimaculis]